MRAATEDELDALLAPHTNHHARVEVRDTDGVWRDLADLEGADWVESFSVDCERIDQPVDSATVNIRRDGPHGLSAAPFMTESPVNILDAAYAPLLDVGVAIRIRVAVLPHGTVLPSQSELMMETGETLETEASDPIELEQLEGTELREIFRGRIDRVAWQGDPIVLSCSSIAAWLMDTQIETLDRYGSAGGVALEDVLQELLDAWETVLGPLTLDVPTSPGWFLREYEQDRVKLLEAMRALALQIGWELRFRYDATDTLLLTLFDVERDATTPLHTFTPDDYEDVTAIEIAIENIRNVVVVPYFDQFGTPFTEEATAEAGSFDRFGRRYMEVQEASTSNINTSTEALALAEAIVHDLASPPVVAEKLLPLWWPAQMGDLYQFNANGTHYDEAQLLGVVGVRHDFAQGEGKTKLSLRGKPSGAYREWLKREVGGRRPTVTPTLTASIVLSATSAEIRYTGGPNVRMQFDDSEFFVPPASPFTIAREPEGGDSHVVKLIAYVVRGRSDQQERELVIPPQVAAPTSNASITGITATDADFPGDGGGSVVIAWTENNLPGGCQINLQYEITEGNYAGSAPTGEVLNIGSSPYTLTKALGPAAPSGTLVLTATLGGVVVATGSFPNGAFAF